MLPAGMVKCRLETGEAAGERREKGMWAVGDTQHGQSTNLPGYLYPLSHSLLPQQKGGRALPSPVPPAARGAGEKGLEAATSMDGVNCPQGDRAAAFCWAHWSH